MSFRSYLITFILSLLLSLLSFYSLTLHMLVIVICLELKYCFHYYYYYYYYYYYFNYYYTSSFISRKHHIKQLECTTEK